MKEINNNEEMLNAIYSLREENIGLIDEDLNEKLNSVTIEEIEAKIEENVENKDKKREIVTDINNLVENYEIKMANFMEKAYKQGFKDAFNLGIECRNGDRP